MKDLAPDIYRQRLIIEGIFTKEVTAKGLNQFMKGLAKSLGMTIILGPIVRNLAGKINPKHSGFECHMIWAQSGASIYVWERQKFFTIDIYTCKKFKDTAAVAFTQEFFGAEKIVFKSV